LRGLWPYLLIWMCWLMALLTLNVKRLERLAIPNLLIWMCWLKALFTLKAERLERLVRPDLLIWMCFYRWRADDAEVFHMKLSFLEVFRNQVQPWNLDRGENSRVFSFSFKQQWWTQSDLGVWTLGFKSIFSYGRVELDICRSSTCTRFWNLQTYVKHFWSSEVMATSCSKPNTRLLLTT
jgi:hypothetical protein